jgi:phage shock protein PspC (stress-responsive transcriptional regulator)
MQFARSLDHGILLSQDFIQLNVVLVRLGYVTFVVMGTTITIIRVYMVTRLLMPVAHSPRC